MARRKRIVCIGGGTGQAQVLQGLSKHRVDLTAIVGVTDNGGHSGVLRKLFRMPQMGDTRNCLAMMADPRRLLTRLLRTRFAEGDLDGVSLGNLIICAMAKERGSLSAAVRDLTRELGLPHRILPVSDDSGDICAELVDGKMIKGEWDIMRRKPRTMIRRVFHDPPIRALPEAVDAIHRADLIALCPGSLLTGIVSVLLAEGIRDAIRRSPATLVQVVNVMTHPGQTDGMTAKGHVGAVAQHLELVPDVVVVNTTPPPDFLLKLYRKDGATPVKLDLEKIEGPRVIRRPLLEAKGREVLKLYARSGNHLPGGPHFIRHDAAKLASLLASLA